MRMKTSSNRALFLSFLAAAAAGTAVPAIAQTHQVHAARSVHNNAHRDVLPILLRARIANLNSRIDMLRERGAIGGEEVQELRKQARRLQGQTYGLSRRDEGDVEFGITRLESRIGFAMDDAPLGGHVYNRDFDDLHADRVERERHEADQHGDYEHFDRYTGSSVDRWHDPFDRGNEL